MKRNRFVLLLIFFVAQFVFYAIALAQLNHTHSQSCALSLLVVRTQISSYIFFCFFFSQFHTSIVSQCFSIKMCVVCNGSNVVELTVTMSQSSDTCDESPSNAIRFKLCFFSTSPSVLSRLVLSCSLVWVKSMCVEFHGIHFMLEEKRRLTGPRGTRRFDCVCMYVPRCLFERYKCGIASSNACNEIITYTHCPRDSECRSIEATSNNNYIFMSMATFFM